jgi:hypothetical protein
MWIPGRNLAVEERARGGAGPVGGDAQVELSRRLNDSSCPFKLGGASRLLAIWIVLAQEHGAATGRGVKSKMSIGGSAQWTIEHIWMRSGTTTLAPCLKYSYLRISSPTCHALLLPCHAHLCHATLATLPRIATHHHSILCHTMLSPRADSDFTSSSSLLYLTDWQSGFWRHNSD